MSVLIVATVEQASSETITWGIDVSPWLEAGESISTPTARLIDLSDGSEYAAGLSGGVSVVGTILRQTVTGLQPRHRYRLEINHTVTPTKKPSPVLLIEVPF